MKKLAYLFSAMLLLIGCDDTAYVERIVLVNPTDYNLLVDVRRASDRSWIGLGTAKANGETEKQEVIDMGATWVFRFNYAGEEVGEDRISRSDLVGSGWRYEIPERVGEALKEKGYAPSME